MAKASRGKAHTAELLVVAALLACGEPLPPNLHNPGRTIVCLGDSLTYGTGSGQAASYPEVLAAELGVSVVNAGVPGDTVEAAARRLDAVLQADPWLVVVELGGNDILRQVPADRTAAAMNRLLDRLLEAGVSVLVIEVRGPLFGERWKRIRAEVERREIPILEDRVAELLSDPRLRHGRVHLNGEGYRQLALAVAARVRPWLQRRAARTPQNGSTS